MSSFKNIIFFGTSLFSKPVFEALIKNGYSPILWDLEKSFESFKKMNPDVCVVAAYGKIIPKEYLEIPKFGFLNVHPSLLPKYRGASPIQTAILNGEKETGVTIILMDEKVDHGPIIAKRELRIASQDDYPALEHKLAKLGAEILIETLPKWVAGKIKPVEQNHDKATYTKKFSWPDGKIDWQKSADEVDRQTRALNPEPGTWTTWDNKILKILESLPIEDKSDNLITGQVFMADNKEVPVAEQGSLRGAAVIKCGFNTALLLKMIQLEGKKPMKIKYFLNGHRDFIGSVLS